MHDAIVLGILVAIVAAVVVFVDYRDTPEEKAAKKEAAEKLAEAILIKSLEEDEQDHLMFYQVEEFRGDFPTDS